MAGLLHNIIEDTDHTETGLQELDVSPAVVEVAVAVTKMEGEDYDDTIARAAAHPLGRM